MRFPWKQNQNSITLNSITFFPVPAHVFNSNKWIIPKSASVPQSISPLNLKLPSLRISYLPRWTNLILDTRPPTARQPTMQHNSICHKAHAASHPLVFLWLEHNRRLIRRRRQTAASRNLQTSQDISLRSIGSPSQYWIWLHLVWNVSSSLTISLSLEIGLRKTTNRQMDSSAEPAPSHCPERKGDTIIICQCFIITLVRP